MPASGDRFSRSDAAALDAAARPDRTRDGAGSSGVKPRFIEASPEGTASDDCRHGHVLREVCMERNVAVRSPRQLRFIFDGVWTVRTVGPRCGMVVWRQWSSGTTSAFIWSFWGLHQSGRRAFDSRLSLVESSSLCLLQSPARRVFKDMAGQSNHFLITILVGLSAVEDGNAVLPPEMRTSWAPHNRSRSAARSREFAIKSLLAWLVDALDTYMRLLLQPPRVANVAIIGAIAKSDANKEGLAGRVRSIATVIGQTDSAEVLLTEIAIIWRNRLVHSQPRNHINTRLASAARNQATQYLESYQGLIIDDLIKHFEHGPPAPPTFKEVTAIVRAVHKLVERTDGYLLQSLDMDAYLRGILRLYLTEDSDARPAKIMARAGNVWGKSPARRLSNIRQIALNGGLSPYDEGAPNELTITAMEKFVNLSPSEAVGTLVTQTRAQ